MNIQQLKEVYQQKFQDLGKKFLKNHQSKIFLSQHTRLVDSTLIKLWDLRSLKDQLCLVAVGGYGRSELFPYSDVDILVLTNNKLTKNETENISGFIADCWDIGLKIGHSVRNIEEAREEFHKDVTTATNLLENRYVIGSQLIFKKLLKLIDEELSLDNFYIEKIKEQTKRHKKYRDSAYQLEPNIKESPGGLRDIQTVIWISSSQKKGRSIEDLLKYNVIDKNEFNKITRHKNRITKRRILLHLLSKSTEDRLSFDLQNQLAEALGCQSKDNKKASEIVMKYYYKSINYIILFNEILLKRLDPKKYLTVPVEHPISFIKYNNLLEIKGVSSKELIKYLFDPFLIMQEQEEIVGFGPNLLGELNKLSKLIDSKVRIKSDNQNSFISLLKANNKVNRTLRLMNKTNVLGKFIPQFGKVVAQMQHDLFHIYTVDEHTLNLIENIRRFSKTSLKHEFPECHKIFINFNAPEILYLAAIFHDIAKGRGGDHSILGEKIARRFVKNYKLTGEHEIMIPWLVKSHLNMSSTAQKKDLTDPVVIDNFANYVENQRNLDALYLLTIADIRATSPHVWNEWKSSLLSNLYNLTTINLSRRSLSVNEIIKIRKNTAENILKKYAVSKTEYNNLWKKFGLEYFFRFEEQDIAKHTRLLLPHLSTVKPIVRAYHSNYGNGIDVMIYTKDSSALFVKITKFFEEIDVEIMQARVFTTSHGYALDVFNLMIVSSSNFIFTDLFKMVEKGLTKAIEMNYEQNKISIRKTKQAIHHNFNTEVSFQKNKEGNFDLQIITDQKSGILNLISNEINSFGFSIKDARINTLGNRVEDLFVISSDDKKITTENLTTLASNLRVKLENEI
jgi:[protein-PII] uridylyltransferase